MRNSTQSTLPVHGGWSNRLQRPCRRLTSHDCQLGGTRGSSTAPPSPPVGDCVSRASSVTSAWPGSVRTPGERACAAVATASKRLSSCSIVHRQGALPSREGGTGSGAGARSRTFGRLCRCEPSKVRRARMVPSPSMCSLTISSRPATAASSLRCRSTTQSRNCAKASTAASLMRSRRLAAQSLITQRRWAYTTLSASRACCRST
mmetsp:Transcript_67221/g.207862  ORF Transcript_67221/g.207862 Transcript_67221/m.207862 type:complete len:205 (-) Transcript_67221:874-1488(-)